MLTTLNLINFSIVIHITQNLLSCIPSNSCHYINISTARTILNQLCPHSLYPHQVIFIMCHFQHFSYSILFHIRDTESQWLRPILNLLMSYWSPPNPPLFMCHLIHFVILDSFPQHEQSTLSISFWSLPSHLSGHTRLVFTARSTFCIYFFLLLILTMSLTIMCQLIYFVTIDSFPHHSQSSLTTLLCKHARTNHEVAIVSKLQATPLPPSFTSPAGFGWWINYQWQTMQQFYVVKSL